MSIANPRPADRDPSDHERALNRVAPVPTALDDARRDWRADPTNPTLRAAYVAAYAAAYPRAVMS